MLMAHRLASTRPLVLNLSSQRLTVAERVEPFASGLLAIACRGPTILGGKLTICSGLRAALGSAAALPGSFDDRVGTAVLARVVLLDSGIELGHRHRPRDGSLVASLRGQIAAVGDRVALVRHAQTRRRGIVALASGLLTLTGRALAHVVAELVRPSISAAGTIAVTGGLIAIGSQLIAIGTGLVSISARLIGVGQRLICVRERLLEISARLLVSDGPCGRIDSVVLSLDPPVVDAHRRIAWRRMGHSRPPVGYATSLG
ncbi:MAG TPA: hypothetical protein VNT54_05895 [Solirubrobacteraceae bacterium]|nr:hypothetical protein [Solirubrobacteraceae bacterium]